LRDNTPGFKGQAPDIEKLLDDEIGSGELKYEGQENIHGKTCHKIKAVFKDKPNQHVYYWVEVATNKLLLMAECESKTYDVYWIKKISKAPKEHVYTVKIPNKELNKFYGYEVVDFRYTSNDLKPKHY